MNWLLILGAYSIISSVLIIQVNVVRSGGVPTVRGDGARKRYSRYNETVRGARSPRSGLALRDRPPSADSGTRESRVSGVVRAAVRLTFAHRRRQAEVALVLFTRRVQFIRSVAGGGGSLVSGDPATSLQTPRATHAKGDHVSDTVPQTPALLQMVFSVLQIRWHADEASRPLRLYVAWGDTSEEH